MKRLTKFSDDRRRYKLSVKGRWRVERGELVSAYDSFSGQSKYSIEEIIAVTDKIFLLRKENGILIQYIRK